MNNNPIIDFVDLGTMPYKSAWEYQEEVFKERVSRKLANRKLEKQDRQYLNNLLLFVDTIINIIEFIFINVNIYYEKKYC